MRRMMPRITDNLLTQEEHLKLKELLESDYFPWFFQDGSAIGARQHFSNYHFGHNFYLNDNVSSDNFNVIEPIVKNLKCHALVRIKGNLYPAREKIYKSYLHTDQPFACKVAIYFVNSNNGYTMIDDQKIESVANRIVCFDSNIQHFGTTCTDQKNRLTLNFNYF